jgi:addiction module RelE/StbE family toxin
MEKTIIVELTNNAEKSLKKIPEYVRVLFAEWVKTIMEVSYKYMKSINGYRDHTLKGNRFGQRSASLTRSYRIIYELKETTWVRVIEVQEINKHEYKK